MEENQPANPTNPEIEKFNEAVGKIKSEMGKIIVGQQKVIDLLLAGLFSGGHVLLEGVPELQKHSWRKCLQKHCRLIFHASSLLLTLCPLM